MNEQKTKMEPMEIMEFAYHKTAGQFMYVEYAHEIKVPKKYADMQGITCVLRMTGRTGCEWSHTKEAMRRLKEREESGKVSEPRKYAGPTAIFKNRLYEGKDDVLFRFLPVHVKAEYFLNGQPIEKSELLKELPEYLFSNGSGIMNLKIGNIIKIK